MRLTLRKAVKGTALFSVLVCMNILYLLLEREKGATGEDGLKFDGLGDQHGHRTRFIQELPESGEPVKTFDAIFRRKPRSAKILPDNDLLKFKKSLPGAKDLMVKSEQIIINNEEDVTRKRKSRLTNLDDIFISVKTTHKYHDTRVKILLDTWFSLAREQTYFFTDVNDSELYKRTNGHVINTNCSGQHNRQALCCKMAQEYDYFVESKKRWFCHVDDDTYVNIPELVKLVQRYNHTSDWYLGKPSLKHPIEIMDKENPGTKLAFWFATGGAGFCISRSLALKMVPYASGGRLMTVGEKIRLPDDCTMGYIINHVLGKKLTAIPSLHSHLEGLWLLRDNLQEQVTFSYSRYGDKLNVVDVPGFLPEDDPTRLYSLHCHLFPYFKQCERLNATS